MPSFNPLDPFGVLRPRRDEAEEGEGRSGVGPGEPRGGSSWLDEWGELTRRLVDPARWLEAGREVGRELGVDVGTPVEVVLVELVDGIARRFAGRRFTVDVEGTELSFVLEGLRVERRGGGEVRVAADAQDVDWGGHHLSAVEVVAHDVVVEPGVPGRLTTGRVDLTVHATPAEALRTLRRIGTRGWNLAAGPGRLVEARPPGRSVVLLVEPVVDGGCLRLDLREVRWWDRRLPLPAWARVSRSFTADLPGGAEAVAAWWEDDRHVVRLHLLGLRRSLDLETLRRAVLAGDSRFVLR
ncbi:MAG: hypothetical protein HYX34_01850 [Actinobacteria bacterium]|nr:hypothetical protein [Actinomycetota bacterium]